MLASAKYNGLIFHFNIAKLIKEVTIIPPNDPSIVLPGLIFLDNACLPKAFPVA